MNKDGLTEAFNKEMEGRLYGEKETQDAFYFFEQGWWAHQKKSLIESMPTLHKELGEENLSTIKNILDEKLPMFRVELIPMHHKKLTSPGCVEISLYRNQTLVYNRQSHFVDVPALVRSLENYLITTIKALP